MRQHHRAGEKLFVDYAGQGIPVVNGHSGEVHEVALFVAVLGASNYTYAEATWTQSLPDWIGSHVRTFAAFGGVPEIVVPDNLKAAVTRAHRYEPEINRTYAALAQHYGPAGAFEQEITVLHNALLNSTLCGGDCECQQDRETTQES
jgi:transposase